MTVVSLSNCIPAQQLHLHVIETKLQVARAVGCRRAREIAGFFSGLKTVVEQKWINDRCRIYLLIRTDPPPFFFSFSSSFLWTGKGEYRDAGCPSRLKVFGRPGGGTQGRSGCGLHSHETSHPLTVIFFDSVAFYCLSVLT